MLKLTAYLTLLAGLCACATSPPKVTTPVQQPRTLAESGTAVDKPSYLNSVGCVDIAALNSKNTPTEILLGSRECVDKKDFDRGVSLFGVAGVYGRFDSQRVPDVSAHEVIPAFQSAVFGNLDSETAAAFQAARKNLANSPKLVQMCAQIRKLGPPTYYPTYMIAHGMGAFLGSGPGLVANFDSAAAWESALATYLHCPTAP
jgi:hypothetical protein